MRKFLLLISTILLSVLLAGIFGIIHDLITFSISPEYFTKFKFIQFRIAPALPYGLAAAIVGFMATWWTGLVIGIILGITGLLFKDYKRMRKEVLKAIGFVFCITISISLLGFVSGKFYFFNNPPEFYYYPSNLIDKKNYIIAGTIHNASYLGGFVGLIAAMLYLIFKYRKVRKPLS